MNVRRDDFGADRGSVIENNADRAFIFDDDFLHGCVGADVGAGFARGGGHRLRDRPHAADGVAPGAFYSVHLAEDVMQEDVG